MKLNTLNKILFLFSSFFFLNVWLKNYQTAAYVTLFFLFGLIIYFAIYNFEYAIYVLAFLLPFESILFAWGAGKYNAVSYIAILVMIYGIFYNKILKKSFNGFELIFIILILAKFFSILWSPDIFRSIQNIFAYSGLFSILYVFHRSIKSSQFLTNCLIYFCWGVGILSLSMFTQYTMDTFIYIGTRKYYSTLNVEEVAPYDIAHYNYSAFLCCLLLIDMLKVKSHKRINIIAIIFFSVFIILSLSRSYILIYLVSVLCWLYFSKGFVVKFKRLFYGLSFGAVILFFATKINIGALEARFVGETLSRIEKAQTNAVSAGRDYIWEVGLELFLQKPILGYGIGQFGPQFKQLEGIKKGSHNQYIKYLVELGLVGFFIFIFLLIALFIFAIYYKHNKGVAMALFFSILLISASHGFYREKGYWFLLGLLFSANHLKIIFQKYTQKNFLKIK